MDRLLAPLEHFGVKLGLDRMRGVMTELGSPEEALQVVLVAGTNGKGSTSALLASIVTAAGYKTGLFTSPHLERVEERVRIDGISVPGSALAFYLERVISACELESVEPVTYFEALTAAALCLFRDAGVELAVFEVGLGGRLDATNVTTPVLSLITGIAFDHQKQLGRSLAEIACEKAGILRPGRPALGFVCDGEAREAIFEVAREIGTEVTDVPSVTRISSRQELGASGQKFVLATASEEYSLDLTLGGVHQAENAALAVSAAERLALGGWPKIDREAIEQGSAACLWPGRLEWVETRRGDVLLDSAHNAAGVACLENYLGSLARPFSLIFGMLDGKVDRKALSPLFALAETLIVTTPPSPRALAADELTQQIGMASIESVDAPSEALARAVAENGDRLIVISGSIYLIGELRGELRRLFGTPEGTERLFR